MRNRLASRLVPIAAVAFSIAGLPVGPIQVSAADPLADIPFAIGSDVLFDEARNDGRQGQHGTWSLERGRIANERLHLHLAIDPPRHGLGVSSGPAILFAGMEAFGGSGDMGISQPMEALATTVIPACDDNDCHYAVDIDLPTDEIAAAVHRLEQTADLMWVSVELTLVRTFGEGEWLQVLPMQVGGPGEDARAGRLGAIERTIGTLFPFGLFPADEATPIPKGGGWMFTTGFDYGSAVERLRTQVQDMSTGIPTVDAKVRVRIAPTCQHAAHLTLHDDAGDRVFDSKAFDTPLIEGVASMPIGTTWHLTLQDGGGIDFDQRQGWGVRIGDFLSDGSPIEIAATFDCTVPSGSLGPVDAAPATGAPPSAVDGIATVVPSISDTAPRDLGDDAASSDPGAVGDGSSALLVAAVLVALGGLVAAVMIRRRRTS